MPATGAEAQISATLNQYGLGGLARWAWNEYKAGVPVEQIFLDLRQRPEYKARFPAMEALGRQGHAISETQYIQLEDTYRQIAHSAGLPPGFYDRPNDFTGFIAGAVSPAEFKTRVDLASQAATTAPPETRAALKSLYGLSQGDLTAYWLDPVKSMPVLQQRFAAAQAGGAATQSGYGALSRIEAEQIAARGLDQTQVQKGFGDLTRQAELFGALPGEAEGQITRDQQLAATFAGSTEDQLRIENEARKRAAEFAGTGRDYAATQRGITGLGSNPT